MKTYANGIETYYEIHGPEGAPWLVLSHSLACSVRMWDPQIEALRDRYRILAYDTRGHGASAAPPGPYTLEMLADDLHGLLGSLGIAQPHFCGLSMGGMIGQTFALKYRRAAHARPGRYHQPLPEGGAAPVGRAHPAGAVPGHGTARAAYARALVHRGLSALR